jgi:hypothetical protein
MLLAILFALMPIQLTTQLQRGQMIQSVNNARQIYLAASTMAEDGVHSNDPRLGWPGDLAAAVAEPVTTLSDYVERLIAFDYLKRNDIGKLFAAPGVRAHTGTGSLAPENSGFKIYRFGEKDDAACIAIATKNFRVREDLDPDAVPFGNRGAVILRKAGDATPFYHKHSPKSFTPLYLPGHHSLADPGVETLESILP